MPLSLLKIVLPTTALLGYFLYRFDPAENSWPVNLAWMGAVLFWTVGNCRTVPPLAPARVDRRALWQCVSLLAVYAAAWLPFYDNWRWVLSADSLGWFEQPHVVATQGLNRSLLSIRGLWNLMTLTSLIVDNALMFLFQPTFFWHRASKLAVTLLSMSAIFTYFSLILDRCWSTAVLLLTATTFMFVLFSYISYNHIDSFIFAYGMLALFTLVLRDPDRASRWALLGTCGGLSLFFTQTAWAEVAVCGVAAALFALATRRFTPLAICAVSFLVAGLPVLLQLRELIQFNLSQTASTTWTWQEQWRTMGMIFRLPLGATPNDVGYNSYFFFWPCGPLYVAGLGLSLAAAVQRLRRLLGLPPAAAGLLLLFVLEMLLMAATNHGYGNPSPKRAYHLLPLHSFFILLPLYTLTSLLGAWQWHGTRRVALVATFVGIAAYGAANISMFVYPDRLGGVLIDGLVQVRQRFADRRVWIIDPRPTAKENVESPESPANRAYGLSDTLVVVPSLAPEHAEATCSQSLFCRVTSLPESMEQFDLATAPVRHRLEQLNLYNVEELQCFACR